MGRNGLIALVALAVLFFALSELVGSDENEGILSQLAGSSASETTGSENAEAGSTSPESREMLDEVLPEEADDFGQPMEEGNILPDEGLIDPAEGSAPKADIDPSEIPAGLENGSPGGQAASSRGRTIPAPRPREANEALMRDLAKAGVIDESRKRR